MTEQNENETQAMPPQATAPVEPPPAEPTVAIDPPAPAESRKPFMDGVDRRVPILAAISALLLIACALLAFKAFAPSQEATNNDIERVAKRFAKSLYTFSYKTIDEDINAIKADATGGFHNELETVLGKVDVFRKAIVDAKGVSTGEIIATEVREVADDSATVRVSVLQSISNTSTKQPRVQASSVELTLVDTDSGWKVDAVQRLT